MVLRAKYQHCGGTVKKHLFITGNGVENESRKEETTESTKPPSSALPLILKYH
jgi:hypothetical protein